MLSSPPFTLQASDLKELMQSEDLDTDSLTVYEIKSIKKIEIKTTINIK